MNKFIFTLLLAASSSCFACKDDLSFTPDKQKHLGVSFVLGVGTELYFQDKTKAFIASSLITTSKEIYDKVSGKGCASVNDMMYNAVGTAMGIYTGSWFIAPNKVVYFKEF